MATDPAPDDVQPDDVRHQDAGPSNDASPAAATETNGEGAPAGDAEGAAAPPPREHPAEDKGGLRVPDDEHGGTVEHLEEGTSLWADAMRRLVKNKAAVGGALVVIFMTLCALSLELIEQHVTHFSYEEQHLAREPKPIGGRSVPQTYFDLMDVDFSAVDENGDGQVSRGELSSYVQGLEFDRLDTDGSGALSVGELGDAPVNFFGQSVERRHAFLDTDGSGALGPEETETFTNIFPASEARFFIGPFDEDGNQTLSRGEYAGVPQPETHYLGTDGLGRDMLTRLVMGARISLAVGFVATLVSFLIGVFYGATAGFLGGWVDGVMMRFVDVMYGLPFIFLVILLMVIFQDIPSDKKLYLLFGALGAVQWLTMSRIVRGQVISLKEEEFVEAAHATGVSNLKIIFRHLIPNALGPIIVYATLTVPAVMLEEAFLSFLGLGVQAPYASWGSLASEGAKAFREFPWLIIFPGAALAITLLSLNFLGDGLRDALDPQTSD